jgi:hypothetical protein
VNGGVRLNADGWVNVEKSFLGLTALATLRGRSAANATRAALRTPHYNNHRIGYTSGNCPEGAKSFSQGREPLETDPTIAHKAPEERHRILLNGKQDRLSTDSNRRFQHPDTILPYSPGKLGVPNLHRNLHRSDDQNLNGVNWRSRNVTNSANRIKQFPFEFLRIDY